MSDVVNVGSAANSGDGDALRTAFQQLNVRLQEILGTFTGRGDWATGLAYVATPKRDWVMQGGLAYAAVTNHTSGVFATDLAAGRWMAIDLLQMQNALAAAGNGGLLGFDWAVLPAAINKIALHPARRVGRDLCKNQHLRRNSCTTGRAHCRR
jgi:hypothetical protein